MDDNLTPQGWTEQTVREIFNQTGFDDDYMPTRNVRKAIADAHNATLPNKIQQWRNKIFDHKWLDPKCVECGCQSQQQSVDTKRREWIDRVKPTITFENDKWGVYGLAGNFCIGKGKTFVEAIDVAMRKETT